MGNRKIEKWKHSGNSVETKCVSVLCGTHRKKK